MCSGKLLMPPDSCVCQSMRQRPPGRATQKSFFSLSINLVLGVVRSSQRRYRLEIVRVSASLQLPMG